MRSTKLGFRGSFVTLLPGTGSSTLLRRVY